MNLKYFTITLLFVAFSSMSYAQITQDRAQANETDSSAAATDIGENNASPSEKPVDRAELENKFKNTLTKSIFAGRWCMVADGKLGEERSEKYTIQSANKIGNDLWLIYARIEYGNKDLLVPVPVSVKWAGDTPVISITNLGIPGLGTYTARVVVYDNTYAGTWSASDHGGQLHGVILKDD